MGATVLARPSTSKVATRLEIVEVAADAAEPRCPVFGTCGGCQLQEMPLVAQRWHKQALAAREVLRDDPWDVTVHPIRGASAAYGYRNKLELSFSRRRYLPHRDHAPDAQVEGSFLGLHPPGWFSKVVAIDGCPLGTPAMNEVIAILSQLELGPAWNTRTRSGVWRHVIVRDGGTIERPQVLVVLVTSSEADEAAVCAAGEAVAGAPGVSGVVWAVTDNPAEVSAGEVREVLAGRPWLRVDLGTVELRLPHDAFFQVNTEGARVLLDVVDEALRPGGHRPGPALLDLYCGVGAIGLALGSPRAADPFERVVGVETHDGAVEDARANAARNGVSGEWFAARVEDAHLRGLLADAIVVDPPRAGLHPRAAAALSRHPAGVLVYVACSPASLGRDRAALAAGGWALTDLWTVDLFPQTHHVEAVGRFLRRNGERE